MLEPSQLYMGKKGGGGMTSESISPTAEGATR